MLKNAICFPTSARFSCFCAVRASAHLLPLLLLALMPSRHYVAWGGVGIWLISLFRRCAFRRTSAHPAPFGSSHIPVRAYILRSAYAPLTFTCRLRTAYALLTRDLRSDVAMTTMSS